MMLSGLKLVQCLDCPARFLVLARSARVRCMPCTAKAAKPDAAAKNRNAGTRG
jgi:hypothetical protein